MNGYLKRAEHAFANLPNTCAGNQKAKPRFAGLKRESGQTILIEAAKLAPYWNPQLALLHQEQLKKGNKNRATPAVVRKLVAYMLAVEKSGHDFQVLEDSQAA
ncbi:MAG: hypothetical protein MI862_09460 [Desulfobacterales bacterium]|nr:hypothetical protein [Desulfobacterales bacterium]